MPEARALEFSPPRAQLEYDFDELLTLVPESTTNKRIFAEFALADVADRLPPDQLLARVGVELAAPGPFDDIPWRDYFRVMLAAAELLAGREQLAEGLRLLGRSVYPRLIQTQTGQLLLGRHMAEALRQAAEVWVQFNTIGQVRLEVENDRELLFHFEDYPAALVESVGVGIFEGLFGHHHTSPEITLARRSPSHTIMRLRW